MKTNLIRSRKKLEAKYTKLAVYYREDSYNDFKILTDNRICSVSPAAYFHVTGINAQGKDMLKLKNINKRVHLQDPQRYVIEKKIKNIIDVDMHTYQIKNIFEDLNFEETNKEVVRLELPRINKNKFKQLQNLFKRFSELSKNNHYKLNNAEKRIIKKKQKIVDISKIIC